MIGKQTGPACPLAMQAFCTPPLFNLLGDSALTEDKTRYLTDSKGLYRNADLHRIEDTIGINK